MPADFAAEQVLSVATTVTSREEADQLARELVDRKLAACVQVLGPITSAYRWQGEIQHSVEWQCVAKTDGHHWESLRSAIVELHSYEEPEIIAVPIAAGSPSYLEWVRCELRSDGD